MKVSDFFNLLKTQLHQYIPHETDTKWNRRAQKIDLHTVGIDTILIMTDFSAQMNLTPLKKECCHVDAHANLAIFYVFTNRRNVKIQESDDEVEVLTCDTWFMFGGCEEKGKKNDWIFHNACLKHIIQFYKSKDPRIKKTRIWTDNCAGQYKCRQNFYLLPK